MNVQEFASALIEGHVAVAAMQSETMHRPSPAYKCSHFRPMRFGGKGLCEHLFDLAKTHVAGTKQAEQIAAIDSHHDCSLCDAYDPLDARDY